MTSSSLVHADDFCSRTHSASADGFGAGKVSSRGPERPKARRAFADPFASLFQWAATTLHAEFSALKHPRLLCDLWTATYVVERSSTSNTSVALGGMLGGDPLAP